MKQYDRKLSRKNECLGSPEQTTLYNDRNLSLDSKQNKRQNFIVEIFWHNNMGLQIFY